MENTEEKSPSQILNEAADLLEEEGRWGQGRYFKLNERQDRNQPACVMCAHGAIAYCGRREVKEKILKEFAYASRDVEAADVCLEAAASATAAAASSATFADSAASADAVAHAARVWGLTVEQYIYKCYKGNTGIAHYRAAKAGLTFKFNDTPGRTKQEIIAKLREAAQTNTI